MTELKVPSLIELRTQNQVADLTSYVISRSPELQALKAFQDETTEFSWNEAMTATYTEGDLNA